MAASPPSLVIGVDNGLDGALCAISTHGAKVVAYTRMPCYRRKGKREIDVRAVAAWVDELYSPFVFVVEEPLRHAPTVTSMRSMALSFGQLLGLARSRDWAVETVEVRPWQNKMLGHFAKGQSKVAALAAARKLAPEETWIPPGCHTPNDGVVDAYLIARFWLGR